MIKYVNKYVHAIHVYTGLHYNIMCLINTHTSILANQPLLPFITPIKTDIAAHNRFDYRLTPSGFSLFKMGKTTSVQPSGEPLGLCHRYKPVCLLTNPSPMRTIEAYMLCRVLNLLFLSTNNRYSFCMKILSNLMCDLIFISLVSS